jgi:hypothetical protein
MKNTFVMFYFFIYLKAQFHTRTYCIICYIYRIELHNNTCEHLKQINESMDTIFKELCNTSEANLLSWIQSCQPQMNGL